jgi:LPXTG-site transpeptidase (sortase) family protein
LELSLRRGRALVGGAALILTLAAGGCGAEVASGGAAQPTPAAGSTAVASVEPVPSARSGSPAPSTRVRFVPTSVVLPGGARAAVEPAPTVDGVLAVPENVQHVGWWDGSAYAGDPFGSTVIAGHVDSATEGLGFFARLLRVQRGEVVTLRAGPHRQRYRVTGVRTVAKQALATTSVAFDQTGDHRLVLITCTGAYLPGRGGYQSNLVVVAEPLGAAR